MGTKSIKSHVFYLSQAFAPDPAELIEKFRNATEHLDFDTIVGTGLSGALVVPLLARALNLKWAIVRKDDGSHSNNKVEGEIGRRWLFVDDFVSSGATLNRVQDAILTRVDSYNEYLRPSEQFYTKYVDTYQYERNQLYSTGFTSIFRA